jgi:hypothetical protein
MGRHQRRNRSRKDKRQGSREGDNGGQQDGKPKEDGRNFVLTTVAHGNFIMETYYAAQGLHNKRWNEEGVLVDCTTHEEREAERQRWRTCIGEILPASFRISKDVPLVLQEQMESELQELLSQIPVKDDTNSSNNSNNTAVMHKLSFLPHAYQMTIDRATMRKSPEMAGIHKWMQHHTACGTITRQETVSMIPPVVLNVQPDNACLDMCAAPGSKTSQILEDLGPNGSCKLAFEVFITVTVADLAVCMSLYGVRLPHLMNIKHFVCVRGSNSSYVCCLSFFTVNMIYSGCKRC